jgi:hypothetical protein
MQPDYQFSTFRAIDEPAASRAYHTAHVRALQRHGVSAVTSSSPDWLANPDVLVIVAKAVDGTLAGGVRLHRSSLAHPMPLEAALAPAHPSLSAVLAPARAAGVVESCGLWVAADHGGRGLAMLLTRYSIALGPQLAPVVYGLAAPHALAMFQTLGFEPVRTFGELGRVAYPTPAYISTLIEWRAADTFHRADATHRARIRSLRHRPGQLCCERVGGTDIWVRYCPAAGARAEQLASRPAGRLGQAA